MSVFSLFFFSILLIFKPQFCVAITNDLLHLSCTERSSIPLDMRIYPWLKTLNYRPSEKAALAGCWSYFHGMTTFCKYPVMLELSTWKVSEWHNIFPRHILLFIFNVYSVLIAFMLIDGQDKIHVVKEQKKNVQKYTELTCMERILLSKLTFSWPKRKSLKSNLLSEKPGRILWIPITVTTSWSPVRDIIDLIFIIELIILFKRLNPF